MIDRCYDPKWKEYKYYGLKGVHTDSKWHTFDGFLEEVELIDGWDLEKYRNRELVLDKDIKYPSNYVYSKETCKWVTREENLGFLPTRTKKMLGISPEGKEYIFYNQTKFAKEHSLIQSHISSVLRGERNHHKGWYFRVLKHSYGLIPKEPHKLQTLHYVAYESGKEITKSIFKTQLLKNLGIKENFRDKLSKLSEEPTYIDGFYVCKEMRYRFDY